MRSAWRSNWHGVNSRWVLDLIVVLSMLLLATVATPIGWNLASISPHPLWIPVLLLSSQYGSVPGIAAAIACMALHWAIGVPAQAGGEDVYDYLHRVWREPLLWPLAAVVLGGLHDRHAHKLALLRSRLVETDARVLSICKQAERLRSHCDALERQIACGAERSIDLGLAALEQVHEARHEELKPALQQAMDILIGEASYLLMTLRDGQLALNPELSGVRGDARNLPCSEVLPDYLEGELLGRPRLLSVRRAGDVRFLAGVALIAAPILSPIGDRVIGVILVQTMDPMRLTKATEHAIGMLCRELSHALSRQPILLAFKRERLPARLPPLAAQRTNLG